MSMFVSFMVISLILFALGAVVGSFLNVVIYRSVIDEDWIHGRSRCDHCKKTIAWYDNIPLFSYFILGGRCRHCRELISISHPVIEFLTGILFVWWYWGGSLFFRLTHDPFQTLQPLFWLAIGILLLILFFADALYMILPDMVTGTLIVLTICYRVALVLAGIMQPADLLKAVMGAVLAVGLIGGLWLITKGKGMGLGDVKLVAPLALLVGWPQIIVSLFLAFVVGAVYGISLIGLGKKKFGQTVPFGPFLIIGSCLSLIWGDTLLSWYIGLL
jgi:leader peptidase (prepilin peptidase)/N-methyltransferase